MKIEDLEKNELVKTLVNQIISDKTFKDKCEINFKQIFEDGKVDSDDIPIIINLVLTVYNNYNKIKVSNINLKPVFMLLISKLLVEFKGDTEIDESLILLMLGPQIDILLMSISTINKCSWCSSRPSQEVEDNMVNKLKINKLDKQKINGRSEILPKKVDKTIPKNRWKQPKVDEILPKVDEQKNE